MATNEIELKHISEMSDFQREVVSALKSLGYEYRFNKLYKHGRGGELINIDRIEDLSGLIKTFYQVGAQEKIWELKKVLEIQ